MGAGGVTGAPSVVTVVETGVAVELARFGNNANIHAISAANPLGLPWMDA